MTGLFANLTRSHRGPSPSYLAMRRAKARAKLNAFAEQLAECGNISEAARRIGTSQQNGSRMFQQIKRELGEQAR